MICYGLQLPELLSQMSCLFLSLHLSLMSHSRSFLGGGDVVLGSFQPCMQLALLGICNDQPAGEYVALHLPGLAGDKFVICIIEIRISLCKKGARMQF